MPALTLPHDFGKYELRQELGSGAFARVFLAWHRALKRNVVLKILRPEIREEPELLERFKVEAEIMASMLHPNIVQVTDMDEFEDSLYIAMEYVEGMDLEGWIKQHGTPPLEVALQMLVDICRGLAVAHQKTIHRDIKPANMIFAKAGLVKLMDFGLARSIEDLDSSRTVAGTRMGTPAYMSPEQDRGEKLDKRSDIFSVGVVAYRLLTGERPFPGHNASEISQALRTTEPRPLKDFGIDFPGDVADTIHWMLAKDRDRRCSDIGSAGRVFERCAQRLGVREPRRLLRRFYEAPTEVAAELVANRRFAPGEMEETALAPEAEAAPAWGLETLHQAEPLPGGEGETVVAESETVLASGRETELASAREPVPPPRQRSARRLGPVTHPAVRIGAIAAVVLAIASVSFAIVRLTQRDREPTDAATSAVTSPAEPPATTSSVPSPDPGAGAVTSQVTPAVPAPSSKPVTPRKSAPVSTTTSTRNTPAGTAATPNAPAAIVPPVERPAEPPPASPPASGVLEIDLKPEVPVYVDDDRVSITGYKRLSLPAGRHTVRATFREFQFERSVEVEPGRTARVAYDLVLGSTGRLRLSLESSDGWGNVVLDGVRRKEQAPGVIEGVPPGTHTVSVEGPMWQLEGPPITVTVVAGQTVTVPIRLKSKGAAAK